MTPVARMKSNTPHSYQKKVSCPHLLATPYRRTTSGSYLYWKADFREVLGGVAYLHLRCQASKQHTAALHKLRLCSSLARLLG